MASRSRDETIAQLHRLLVGSLRRESRDVRRRPVTVAEIYQDLVPYRQARLDLGFAMNADYEHALMRLLAGEGALVRLEPEVAQRELQRELEGRNPDVTLYRKFAACDVWVESLPAAEHGFGDEALESAFEALERGDAPPAESGSGPWPAADTPGAEVGEVEDLTPTHDVARASHAARDPEAGREPAGGSPAGAAARGPGRVDASAPAVKGAPPSRCEGCGEAMPSGRPVRYCPHCGRGVARPCTRCGERVESEWRFCVACGAAAGESMPAGD